MRKVPCTWSDTTPLFRHGDAAGGARDGLVDCSVSVNPLGPPASVLRSLKRLNSLPQPGDGWIPLIGRYPDSNCSRLGTALAFRHGIAGDQVVVGNGTNDLIYAAARVFRPRRVAIVEPTYTEYFRASLRAGASVEHWLADGPGFEPKPFDPRGADLVWLANPNNPTGRLWAPGRLVSWIEAHPRTLFVVDEAFLPFRPDEVHHSLIAAVHRLGNLIVLRSLTKLYTLPGLRLGYAVAASRLAAQLQDEIIPWSVNALAQAAGLVALEDRPFLAQTHAWFTEEALPFPGQLRNASTALAPIPSEANFVLVRLQGTTADQLVNRLAKRGFAVRDASNFIGLDNHYVRVAVRQPEDNRRLLDALRTESGDG